MNYDSHGKYAQKPLICTFMEPMCVMWNLMVWKMCFMILPRKTMEYMWHFPYFGTDMKFHDLCALGDKYLCCAFKIGFSIRTMCSLNKCWQDSVFMCSIYAIWYLVAAGEIETVEWTYWLHLVVDKWYVHYLAVVYGIALETAIRNDQMYLPMAIH